MTTTYQCPRCNEQSIDPNDCSECGAPIGALTIAASTSTINSSPNSSVAAVRSGSMVRAGGYSATGKVTGARRPQVSTANFGTGSQSMRASGETGRQRASKGSSSRRKALGGGLIQMPIIPSQDPMLKVLADPKVPENKCFCPNPTCADKDGNRIKVNPNKKFCSNCGAEYSFKPALKAGDMVSGQYEVKGAMAFGGLGWIYLAQDKKVNDRWVVLKGLLNTKDAASAAAAVAERQFLSSIKHGKIVGIYNFVTHNGEGYIVMEYVGGRTLKDVRKENGPLPPEQAVAYIIGILPAFAYLHDMKLVYCDFSPDNVMLEGEDVKLIDLGATRRIGDSSGDIFGKEGYMAAEASYDPSEPSDLFTIGRTLAALITDMSMRVTSALQWPTPLDAFVSRGVGADGKGSNWSATLEGGDPLPSWLKFSPQSREFTGKAPAGVLQVAVTVTAQRGAIKVDLPFDIVMPLGLPEPQDARLEVPVIGYASAGVDIKDTLIWTATLSDGSILPAWLKLDTRRGILSGSAPQGVVAVEVMVTARDSTGKSASLPFTVRLPFAEYESLYRLLLKATAYESDARFQSCDEMMGQLTGVLREMVARKGPIPSADDPDFLRERTGAAGPVQQAWRALPELRIDDGDTAKSEIFAAGGTADVEERQRILKEAVRKNIDSSEARLRLASLLTDVPDIEENNIMALLDQAAALNPWDWRPDWYCGVMRLALGQPDAAIECFDRVYSELPGSVPPKAALALALEMAGRSGEASALFDTTGQIDPALTVSSFGLARTRLLDKDRKGAVDAYSRVPAGSSQYSDAMLGKVSALSGIEAGQPSLDDIIQASVILCSMSRKDIPRYIAEVSVLMQGINLIKTGIVPSAGDVSVLGAKWREKDMRLRAENALMNCARIASSYSERVAYTDAAAVVRPRTLW